MTDVIAVDLGAQSGRVSIGRFDGTRLEVEEVHRFPNDPVTSAGALRWNVYGLSGNVLDGLRLAAKRANDIKSLAVDAWAVDFGLLDRTGRMLQLPLHYRDAGRGRAVESVLSRIAPRELYSRTGIQLMPINTVFELAALAEENDSMLTKADHLLLIPDLIHHWLCGSKVTERTNATTTQCFDPTTNTWATDVLEQLEIPTAILPPVVEPGTDLGPLTRGVADETSLTNARVIAPGTHDTASAVAAVPFQRDDAAYVSAGSWSLVGLETSEPLINDRTFAANLTNEGGVGETNRLLRNVNGLWLVHECRDAWERGGTRHLYEQLVNLAEQAPALASFIDPDTPAFHEPGDIPERVKSFCAATGQTVPETPGEITRCVVESIAMKQAHVVDTLADVTGAPIPEVHVVGGGARNRLLCQTTADALGREVVVGPVEATTLGNLIVQLVALGEIDSLAQGRAIVRNSFPTDTRYPSSSSEMGEARAQFSELVGAQPGVHA